MKKGWVLMGVLLLSFLFLASCTQGNEKDQTWIVGFWVTEATTTPHSTVIVFNANGTFSMYDNYACSGAPVASGTWSLEDDVLKGDGVPHTIVRVSADEWYEDPNHHMYRKGTEPGGNIFGQPETELTAGNWTDGDLPFKGMKLYSFTSSSAGDYTVRWEDFSDGPSYTGDVRVSAYRSDQATEIFFDNNGSNPPPQTVALGANEKIFLIVEAAYAGGTYCIKAE